MAQQCIDAYHSGLIAVVETLYKIDEMVALWPFTKPTIHEAGLLTNPTSLGHSIHQLTLFLRVYIFGMTSLCLTWIFLMGFSMDYNAFMGNAQLMLTNIHAKHF